ncbi:uncharacterized protein EAE97_004974 [Botrytis byssoidea]|uniref:UBA domain-containing protein n=1 Tax=Botrytis byssoidea TaxID=139641 RepID=A0A9P5M0D6_9HELO|nr:uncharacterized protein EAE97_004974 [Botrytis byssoidea]KAF7945936.1 hypothetical protein EAE97_004974 [Botrytis byssoidea]
MSDLNKSASEPLAHRAASELPAQEDSQLNVENVAELGFDNELIRFAVFHTNGSIWEAADVLLRFESRRDKGNAVGLLEFALWIAENDQVKALRVLARFRSGTPAQPTMQGAATSSKSIEKSNNETTQKQSTLEEVAGGGESQSKGVAENGEGASTIVNAVEEAKATLPSNKPAKKTTMTEIQHARMSNNSQDNKTQRVTNSNESKSNMDLAAIQTGTIIARTTVLSYTESKEITAAMKGEAIDVRKATTNPEKSASGSGIKRKLEVIEISDDDDDDDDDDGADVDAHDYFQPKEENGDTESIAAENASAKNGSVDDGLVERSSNGYHYDSTNEQEPNRSPLVNEKAWRVKKMAWAEEILQKSKSHIRVSGERSPPHHGECFRRGIQEKSTLATIRKNLLILESKAFPDPTKCILEGAIASATIEFKYGCLHCLMTHKWQLMLDEMVVLLISNRMPPKEGLLALEASYISSGSNFTKNKLCGNKACRRPSHVIGESREASGFRRICRASRKKVLENDQVPEDKCVNGDKHYPECMRDLTLSDEASYRACTAHNFK